MLLLSWLLAGTARSAVPVVDPGDTNLAVLATGGTSPLISRVSIVPVDTNAPGGLIEFDLGFATQEAAGGVSLVDSMTVTLLDAGEQSGAVLLVADANGVAWMPPTPGGLVLPAGYLEATVIEPPEIHMGLSGLNVQFAYHLAVRIPSALWGPHVKVALDLFDYPNGLVSVAWNGPIEFVPDLIPPCVPPPLGLAAWWKADGDALDAVGQHPGTVHGTVAFAAGRVGRAFSFEGTDASDVSVPARAELSPQAGPYPPAQSFGGEISVDAWIHMPSLPSATEGLRTVLAKDGEYELAITSAGALRFTVWGSNGSPAVAEGGSLSIAAWHHVAGTFRQRQFIRAYVDGSRVDDVFSPEALSAAGPAPLLIGRRQAVSGGAYFRGWIDEISLYHHALSDADVAGIHAAGVSGKCLVPLTLRAERQGTGVRLRWRHAAGGAVLEQSDTLADGAAWSPSPAVPLLSGDDVVADVPAAGAAKFYRLRR